MFVVDLYQPKQKLREMRLPSGLTEQQKRIVEMLAKQFEESLPSNAVLGQELFAWEFRVACYGVWLELLNQVLNSDAANEFPDEHERHRLGAWGNAFAWTMFGATRAYKQCKQPLQFPRDPDRMLARAAFSRKATPEELGAIMVGANEAHQNSGKENLWFQEVSGHVEIAHGMCVARIRSPEGEVQAQFPENALSRASFRELMTSFLATHDTTSDGDRQLIIIGQHS